MSEELTFLTELGIIAGTALAFTVFFMRIKLPPIIGQLFAGILVGPFGLGFVKDIKTINLFAEIGIILLLFIIGLELDPFKVRQLGHRAFTLAVIEISASFLAGWLLAYYMHWRFSDMLILAVVLSISSTAVVGKILLDNRLLDKEELHIMLSVLVIEDFVAVFFLAVVPSISGGIMPLNELLMILLKAGLLFGLVAAFGYIVAHRLIDRVASYEIESEEATFLTALSLGFVMAIASGYLGLPPATGAFLMGLMLVGKRAHFVTEKLRPIKDLFIVIFFASMGMLIDVASLVEIGIIVIPLSMVVLFGKTGGCIAGCYLVGLRRRAVDIALSMIPRGEFSLIIAKTGVAKGASQLMLPMTAATTLVSAVLGPALLAVKQRITR